MDETIITRTGPVTITPDDETRMQDLNAALNDGYPAPDRFDDFLTFASKVFLAGCIGLGAVVAFFVLIHGGYHQ